MLVKLYLKLLISRQKNLNKSLNFKYRFNSNETLLFNVGIYKA